MFWKRWLYGCLCVVAGAKDMTSRDGAVNNCPKKGDPGGQDAQWRLRAPARELGRNRQRGRRDLEWVGKSKQSQDKVRSGAQLRL
ncbi:uncharacterized protein LY79DRAFT_537684 [Colletotrichum navitas]|uniref:Secreted protein n=1 Tax=Colletotrichum navitas TaxID=681940 RepID=A0AAD8VB57_9PEZI|nr:uncharacterized protein LY79DRAFT_537684 [Colletotrichum navitas]KAK1598626.1 hypothetical protein LY79DRAFT_537684 [Colletotrichum navitas]